MDQGLTIFRTGAQVSTAFNGVSLPTQRLDEGVEAGFARVTYKRATWGVRYQGKQYGMPYRMPDGTVINSPFLDIVILRSAGHPNKAWYAGAYSEEETRKPPDCWSSNGVKPDDTAPNKQSPTCLGCKWNVWGSKVQRDTGLATRGKACMDMKRVAVVPVGDIENKAFGGPMMLSIPASSLKQLGPYQNQLEANGFNYAQVWTRITFQDGISYPMFNFDAMAALNDVQAAQVIGMLNHPMINRILNTDMKQVEAWDESAEYVHQSIQPEPAQVHPGDVPAAQDDPGPPPDVLRRQPAQPTPPAPNPAPEPPQAPQEAAPEPPEPAPPTLPGGITLPPGMTPEMAAAFMAQFAGQQAPAKRRGRPPRTPPVSPTPMDSAAVSQPALPAPAGFSAKPQPQTNPAPTNAGNGHAQPSGNDPALAQLMSTIGKLV